MPIVEGEVQRALDQLPNEFKLAVILCDVEEFSYEEIASITDASINTVKTRLRLGKNSLRRRLEQDGHAPRGVGGGVLELIKA